MPQDIRAMKRREPLANNQRSSELEELWDVEYVAKKMRVSTAKVYKMIHDGQLEAVRIGRLYRITPEGYRRMLEKQSSICNES